MQPDSSIHIPAGYRALRDRSRPDALERLVEAERDGVRVALRISSRSAEAESRAELAVLASVRHPGLATLLDYGTLADGGSFVAREWIEGADLAEWSRGRPSEDVGALVARLCVALQALHARGFVHGDLKANNVLVRETADGPRPVLTDFGLARASGAASTTSGTLFHMAPELLLGGEFSPSSDLFALGAMLHELLLGRRATARDFYGKFPAFDFFEASQTRLEDLPTWSRDCVASLLEREPSRRPPSASALGSTLAGRLGVEGLFREAHAELHWSLAEGRLAWRDAWERELDSAREPVLRWLLFTTDEDPSAWIGELALHTAVRGARVRRFDVLERFSRSRDAADLDRVAAQVCGESKGLLLFTALTSNDPWSARIVDVLAQTIEACAEGERPRGLIVGARTSSPNSERPWVVDEIPEVNATAVAEFVRANIEVDAARFDAFVRLLHDASEGSATRADHALQRAIAAGWIVSGDARARLRPGALPTSLAESRRELSQLSAHAARAFAATLTVGGRARLSDVRNVAALEDEQFTTALQQLVVDRWVALERGSGGTYVLALVPAPEQAHALIAEALWREMHGRRAHQLAEQGAAVASILPHGLRAGTATAGDIAVECENLRDRGSAELALQLCDAAIAQRHAAGVTVEPDLIGERALAWCAIGDADRALEAISGWNDASRADAKTNALVERVRGQVAMQRHESARAIEHFEAASRFDPDDGGWSALGKSRLYFELGRDREVLTLCAECLRADASRKLLPRVAAMLRTTEAMSLFRVGEVARAKEILESQLLDARATSDVGREAGLRINLATVERRAGRLPLALEHFERATQLYETAGLLPGLAQARAQFGSTLREVGELARAEPLLASALSLRERLGDRVGATSVRGMLGLLLADRGHVRAAVEELERAARDLRESGRSRVAVMLEARALECRARFGDFARLVGPAATEVERAAEGDPRVLTSRARALWLSGDPRAALEHARRAESLTDRLGLAALSQEAKFLRTRLEGAEMPPLQGESESLVAEDARLLHLLARAPLDVDAARRMAEDLARRGRDDRAARLLLAIAARGDRHAHTADAERAEQSISLCTRGLAAHERAAFSRTLLCIADPWPEDFVAHERRLGDPEDEEMEVIRLLEINHRLLAQEDLRTLLGLIVEQALAVSGAQRGFLILEEEGELKVDTALDSRRGDIDTPDVEVSGSVLREALAKMKPVRVSNAVDDPLLRAAPSVIELELRSILCVPFEVHKGLRGVIYADHRLREGAFDSRAERMLSFLADQAALAILQVRRLEEIRRLNRELGRTVARKDSDLKTAAAALRKLNVPAPAGGLVGDAPPMREVRRLIERAATSKLAVLVTGPSGSGKELAARALHELGPRSEGPFISENCAALPASLIEAELFGARKGAYTGSDRDREGLFERSAGGTLFLDEIGELPLELQAKLLRVLETSQVRRVGDDRVRNVDFRLVAATNRDLVREVAEGRFRADLYYRLDGLRIAMPSLASRTEDIPALVDHCLRLQAEPGQTPRRIAPAVLAKLCRRPWPGNVRELFNEVSRLVVMSEGDLADPELVRESQDTSVGPNASAPGVVKPMEQLEREAILHALQVARNDKRKAADLLGISRAKVYQRLKDWGLTGGDKGDES